MGIPFGQVVSVGSYLMKQKLLFRKRYPLVLMLEPLYRCNLVCTGCGKIQRPEEILKQHLSVEECEQAVNECPAPIVTVAGGEPLIHPQASEIVEMLVKKKRYVYFCTNAILLKSRLDKFKPSKYLTFSVHLDGMKETHDHITNRPGCFDKALEAIKAAKDAGFRVAINCTLFEGHTVEEVREMFDLVTKMGIDNIMVAPGYSYERAPDQHHFLKRERTRKFFRQIFDGPAMEWPINQSRFYLEFLMGTKEYKCTPWGNPCRSVLGWQRPCYLMESDIEKPFVSTFKELMEDTDWDKYGTGNHPQCAQCMAHCGYEASAVADTMKHPINMMIGGRAGLPKPSKKLLEKDRREAAEAPAAEGTTIPVHGCGAGDCSTDAVAQAGEPASTTTA